MIQAGKIREMKRLERIEVEQSQEIVETLSKLGLESLQLDLYALAHLRTKGRLPSRVELRFLETGLAAGKRPTLEEAARTETRVEAAAAAIRRRDFPATPTWMACGQCPFRDICPSSAA